MLLKLKTVGFLAMTWCIVGCHFRAASHGPIIEGYKAAACIPVLQTPDSRSWETPVTLSNGSKVMIFGSETPGGRVIAQYVTTGRQVEVANAGDYVYPADVRYDAPGNLLFVKASGLALGITHETWLFKYDLGRHRLVERRRVADSAMPTECSESP